MGHSSPSFTQMSAVSNGSLGNAPIEGHRRSPVVPDTTPEFVVDDDQSTRRDSDASGFGSTLRSFQNLRNEQLYTPLDLPANFGDIDWDAELDKVMVSV